MVEEELGELELLRRMCLIGAILERNIVSRQRYSRSFIDFQTHLLHYSLCNSNPARPRLDVTHYHSASLYFLVFLLTLMCLGTVVSFLLLHLAQSYFLRLLS